MDITLESNLASVLFPPDAHECRGDFFLKDKIIFFQVITSEKLISFCDIILAIFLPSRTKKVLSFDKLRNVQKKHPVFLTIF